MRAYNRVASVCRGRVCCGARAGGHQLRIGGAKRCAAILRLRTRFLQVKISIRFGAGTGPTRNPEFGGNLLRWPDKAVFGAGLLLLTGVIFCVGTALRRVAETRVYIGTPPTQLTDEKGWHTLHFLVSVLRRLLESARMLVVSAHPVATPCKSCRRGGMHTARRMRIV